MFWGKIEGTYLCEDFVDLSFEGQLWSSLLKVSDASLWISSGRRPTFCCRHSIIHYMEDLYVQQRNLDSQSIEDYE